MSKHIRGERKTSKRNSYLYNFAKNRYLDISVIAGTKYVFRFKRPVKMFMKKEQGILIAKIPELGIVEYGESLSEVEKSIGENLEVFYEEARKASKLTSQAEKIISFINIYCEVDDVVNQKAKGINPRIIEKRIHSFRKSSPLPYTLRRTRLINKHKSQDKSF